jgi:hypothetical protein
VSDEEEKAEKELARLRELFGEPGPPDFWFHVLLFVKSSLRLDKLIGLEAPDIIIKNEHKCLQDRREACQKAFVEAVHKALDEVVVH